ncbi:MAG TPA: MBL fold metallo-hydrolase [Gaiellaceae bacterium]|nr:MBL fold metallo-hydrolase [Gaiellaceae bacterium]
MKVTVVGCSPAWPNPGGAQSGYLVEGSGRLLLDCGPGVLPRLRNDEPWPNIDAIAITHFHLDHWGDLVPWTWGSQFGPGRGLPQVELWLPPAGRAHLRHFGTHFGNEEMFERAFTLREYEDGVAFEAAGLRVTPVRVPHYEIETYGFRVTDGSRLLSYSGDSAPSAALVDVARDADLFLCEATLGQPFEGNGLRGHLAVEEAVDAFEQSGARRLVIVHRPHELPVDASYERASDGDVFEV